MESVVVHLAEESEDHYRVHFATITVSNPVLIRLINLYKRFLLAKFYTQDINYFIGTLIKYYYKIDFEQFPTIPEDEIPQDTIHAFESGFEYDFELFFQGDGTYSLSWFIEEINKLFTNIRKDMLKGNKNTRIGGILYTFSPDDTIKSLANFNIKDFPFPIDE